MSYSRNQPNHFDALITMKTARILAAIAASLPLTSFAGDFDGFYGKAVLGVTSATDHGSEYRISNSSANGLESKASMNGGLYGLAAGFNKKLDNQFLVGIEFDYDGRGSANDTVYQKEGSVVYSTNYQVKSSLKETASVRTRLGYVINNKALMYATAGYTTAKISRTYYDFRAPPTQESHTKWQDGWTLGLGGECMLGKSLSASLEYRYADFGKDNVTVTMWDRYEKQKLKEQSIRLGIAYQF